MYKKAYSLISALSKEGSGVIVDLRSLGDCMAVIEGIKRFRDSSYEPTFPPREGKGEGYFYKTVGGTFTVYRIHNPAGGRGNVLHLNTEEDASAVLSFTEAWLPFWSEWEVTGKPNWELSPTPKP